MRSITAHQATPVMDTPTILLDCSLTTFSAQADQALCFFLVFFCCFFFLNVNNNYFVLTCVGIALHVGVPWWLDMQGAYRLLATSTVSSAPLSRAAPTSSHLFNFSWNLRPSAAASRPYSLAKQSCETKHTDREWEPLILIVFAWVYSTGKKMLTLI